MSYCGTFHTLDLIPLDLIPLDLIPLDLIPICRLDLIPLDLIPVSRIAYLNSLSRLPILIHALPLLYRHDSATNQNPRQPTRIEHPSRQPQHYVTRELLASVEGHSRLWLESDRYSLF